MVLQWVICWDTLLGDLDMALGDGAQTILGPRGVVLVVILTKNNIKFNLNYCSLYWLPCELAFYHRVSNNLLVGYLSRDRVHVLNSSAIFIST